MRSTRIIYFISLLLLTACGGDSQETTSVSLPASTVIETVNLDLTGQSGSSLLLTQQVQGSAKVGRTAVNSSFSNAIGTLRHANSGTSVQGNLTLGVTAADSDELTKVSIYLPSVNKTLTLCSGSCAPNYQATITGFSPQLAGVPSGALRIELVVDDGAGNSVVVDALNLNWQPLQISAINATRENDVIAISWSGNSNLNRYNVYAATQSGLNLSNVLNLDNGVQQLAINGTSVQFPDADPTKDYHLLVTGIDGGGESGLSSLYTIPRSSGTPNQAPDAINDSFEVNEDEILSANVLVNDLDPEGQLITVTGIIIQPSNGVVAIDELGNLTYSPNVNFFGRDSLSYQIVDSEGGISEAVVAIDILSVNDNPIAVADFYGIDVNGKIDQADTDLLLNDSDIDGDELIISTTPIEGPEKGTVIINPDGSFSYQANEELIESDYFVYQVADEQGGTSNATVTILASQDVLAPIAQNDDYQVDEDKTLVIDSINLGILANDSDPNNLSFKLVESLLIQPQHGQLNLSLDGTFTYLPDSDFFGVDQFQYQIHNSGVVLAQAFVTITVNPSPDIPIALADRYQTSEDLPLQVDAEIGLLANDVDLDKGLLRVNTTPLSAPLKGTLVLAENGSFSYAPNEDFNGIDSFTYQVVNENNLASTANVNIIIDPVNDAPVVTDDVAVVDEDNNVVVNVLANDSDKEGDALTLKSVVINNGTAVIVNNTLSVTPAANFFGELSVLYTVADNFGASSNGQLLVTVLPINDLPLAIGDSYLGDKDKVLNILATDSNQLLSNDRDVDGDVLIVKTIPLTNVTNGSLALNSNGSFSYTPTVGFTGVDGFTYQISDGHGEVSQANVVLTIADLNDAPVALSDSYSVIEDNILTITNVAANHLLVNDSDADGVALTVNTTPISNVSNGSLILNNDGSFVYTPNADYNGVDNFIYQISDGDGGTAQATVSITVSAINDIPVASSDIYTIDEDISLIKLVTDPNQLLSNDSDVDGDTLTVSLVTTVTKGSLTLNTDGSFNYTPNADFNGADTFTYEINDGNGGTDQASVDLTILAVNDAPTAINQTFNIDEDKTNGDTVGTVVVTDKESDTLSFSLTAGDTSLFNIDAATGIITVNGVTPLDFETNIQHSITVTILDDGSPSAESTDITVTVNVNDILEAGIFNEIASFGRPAIGFLELTGGETQAKLNHSVNVGSKVYFIGSIDNVNKDVYVAAYNNDGSLDTSFNTDGKKTFDFGDNEYGKAIVEIAGNLHLVFERDDGSYTEVCFLKIDNTGDIVTSFAVSGLRCTDEQKIMSINDAVDIILPVTQGDEGTLIPVIVAVGKVKDAADDDLLVIRVDEDGNFQTSTIYDAVADAPIVYSPHIILDITGDGLDDEGIAVYNPHNYEIMIAGNVLTADGDYDIFAWIFNPKNADGNYVKFNNSTPQTYDVGGIGEDDKVGAIDGENTGAGEHTAHVAGSTVLANGEQDAFIIELDSYAALVSGFGANGVAIYDVDGVETTGSSKFTGYVYNYSDDYLYLTGTLYDGKYKPFATRIDSGNGTVNTSYGNAGYQVLDYAGNNAYSLGICLDSSQKMWVPGYVESGSDTEMIISAFDSNGDAYNANDMVNGKNTLTDSSTPSDDIAAEVIQIQDVAQQDKFLIASTADDAINKYVILTRLTTAGALDTSFSSDGHKQVQVGSSATVSGIFELANGKYIIYGNVTEGSDVNGYVARLEQNGNLDITFANNGIYTTSAIGVTPIQFNQAAADSNGNIIVVGTIDNSGVSAFILNLTSVGILNTNFKAIGYVIGSNTDEYLSLLIDSSDNIYAAGSRSSTYKDMLVVKYLENGEFDGSFNAGGVKTIDVNAASDDIAQRILFDSNNDLYIIGNNFDTQQQVSVVKLSTAGLLDSSFDSDGIASFIMAALSANAGITDAVIDNADNIYVVGFGQVSGTNAGMVGRIKPDGDLDLTLNLLGYFGATSCANTAQLESVILLNNSSLVVAGQCYIDVTSKNNIEISQYQLN